MNDLYRKAALAAYQNSLDLLEDANILFKQSRFARAYALGALSLEEFAKAFLYRCYSAGLITDPGFDRDITLHKEKLFHGMHLLTSAYTLSPESTFARVITHDKRISDHSQHLLPKAAPKIALESMNRIEKLLKIFAGSHELKLSGIYTEVDRKNGKVVSPSDIIKATDCNDLLTFLNTYMNGFEIILRAEDDRFRKDVELLDPQILSGTMKSDFNKYLKKEKKERN